MKLVLQTKWSLRANGPREQMALQTKIVLARKIVLQIKWSPRVRLSSRGRCPHYQHVLITNIILRTNMVLLGNWFTVNAIASGICFLESK